ncbi:helix-turn-helix transcriptional regulator [Rhodococcus sp. KBS0724]|uniref:helix-turn-helix domain-containing protein n=1 Tax=Rhodococcus sp. KBS0724 TaxID=1179674 RepID=UPI00110E8CBA|nr:helix-turn-helix transcriptional regulator [Rhodococcus sp. KBS0724]TSD47956.1 helix-turn-helix transcriptional regulator [Rhodococcus sp. KBS0724]
MGNDWVGSAEDAGPEDRFGKRVRQEREARGWTQADLARELQRVGLNLHPSAIAKIELRNVARPRAIRLDEAEAIAKAFGLSVDSMYQSAGNRIRTLGNQTGAYINEMELLIAKGRQLSSELNALTVGIDDDERRNLRDQLSIDAFEGMLATVADSVESVIQDVVARAESGLPSNDGFVMTLPPSRFSRYRNQVEAARTNILESGDEETRKNHQSEGSGHGA